MGKAKFFEGEYPKSNTSEKKIAEILKKFSNEWTIFHSVKVHDPETEKLTNTEIDFLLIHPTYGFIQIEGSQGPSPIFPSAILILIGVSEDIFDILSATFLLQFVNVIVINRPFYIIFISF